MTQPTRQLLAFSAAAVLLSAALTACGGGSDSSESEAEDTGATNGVITKQCAGDSSTAQVPSAGCVKTLGASASTLVCTGPNTVYRLLGTNHTRDEVLQSNNSYTAGGTITLEGVKIQCI